MKDSLRLLRESVCVVIPAYQAQGAIGPLVRAVVGQGFPVIVVDDASPDRTAQEAQAAGAQVVRRPVNGGKGVALREGLTETLRSGCPWILTMDADGQHLPEEIPRFLEAAASGGADLILGNRMGRPAGMPWDRRLTNRFLSWLLSRISGVRIPDTQCGFRLISRSVLDRIRLTSDRFEIESELVVKSARAGCRIRSIPISSVYRRQFSFIQPIRDTFRFLRFLRRLNRDRARRPDAGCGAAR